MSQAWRLFSTVLRLHTSPSRQSLPVSGFHSTLSITDRRFKYYYCVSKYKQSRSRAQAMDAGMASPDTSAPSASGSEASSNPPVHERGNSNENATDAPSSPKRRKLDTSAVVELSTPAGDRTEGEQTPALSANEAGPSMNEVVGEGEGQVSGKGQGQTRGQREFNKKEKPKKDRRRATRRPDGTDAPQSTAEDGQTKAPRLPKRQCAILLGFCGAGYNGMQHQPQAHVRTIEGVIFDTLVKVGAVSQDNADDPVNLSRAARTDAGVHAAGNLVSMKLITKVPGVPDLVARINEELPPEIRLWSFVRVMGSFQARGNCDSRKYTYFFPSYLLIPPKPDSGLHKTFTEQANDPSCTPALHEFWALRPDSTQSESSPEEDLVRKRQWRVSKETMEDLRRMSQKYLGTHNFHNLTVGRGFSDRSCNRHMKSIEIADPVVYGNTEWISVLIHGQSFMLHQRKMVALLILACRTGTPPQVLDELFGPRNLFVPKMPALGLLLEYPIFSSYNRKIENNNSKLQPTDEDYRPAIDFETHREKMEKFKDEFIYGNMRSTEDQLGVFDKWIRSIDAYSGNDLLYLNPKGTIPPNAVIKQGERRPNPFRERKLFDSTSFAKEETANLDIEQEEAEEEEEGKLDKAKLADMEG